MLGFCRDPLIRELHKLGYSLIPLPETQTSPLDCFVKYGKELFRLGKLEELFAMGKTSLPPIARNTEAAELKIRKSDVLDSGLAVAMLSQWLGGKGDLSGKLGSTAKFAFELKEVRKDNIGLKALDDFLVSARLNIQGPAVREMIEGDDVYVTTSVLKASSLSASSTSGTLVEGNVQVPEIQGIASASGNVNVKTEGDRSLAFEATKPLVFAFQAVQLCFLNGAYRSLRIERSKLQLMSDKGLGTSDAVGETGWLCDRVGSTFARFGARAG